MASSQSMFSSFDPCHNPPILMGNHTYMNVIGKGTIDKGEGHFKDVLCVPHLSHNLLSIYQLTHGDRRRIVEFTLDLVFIRDLETRQIIATGVVDHASRLYYFSDFAHDDDSDFLADSSADFDHTSCVDSDFEEDFGYLNLGILTCDQVLESSTISPPTYILSTIVLDDSCTHIAMDSNDSMQ